MEPNKTTSNGHKPSFKDFTAEIDRAAEAYLTAVNMLANRQGHTLDGTHARMLPIFIATVNGAVANGAHLPLTDETDPIFFLVEILEALEG